MDIEEHENEENWTSLTAKIPVTIVYLFLKIK